MNQEGCEQQARADPRASDDLAPGLHRLHRIQADETQRVIEEMRGGEREEHETGGEPQPLQDIAACQNVHVPDHRIARGVRRNSEAYCADPPLRKIGAIRLTPIAPYDKLPRCSRRSSSPIAARSPCASSAPRGGSG